MDVNVDMSWYGYGMEYDEDGTINKAPAVFQTEVLQNINYLEELITPILMDDDPEEMLRFMNTYLDPQISQFYFVLDQVYSYIYELAIAHDAAKIIIMLMDRGIVLGFSGDLSFFETYYEKFWSYCPDTTIDIIFSVFPGNDIEFFRYCTSFLKKRLHPQSVNVKRFLKYCKVLDRHQIYINNYFLSVFDVACYLYEAYPNIFVEMKREGLMFNQEVHQLSPSSYDCIDEIARVFNVKDIKSMKMSFLKSPQRFYL